MEVSNEYSKWLSEHTSPEINLWMAEKQKRRGEV